MTTDHAEGDSLLANVPKRSNRVMVRRVLLAWVLVNLAIWFAPNAKELVEKSWRYHQRQQVSSPYQYGEVDLELEAPKNIPYLLFAPDLRETPGNILPLIVILHGAGHRGSDGSKHLACVETFLTNQRIQNRHPCLVVAPQCPSKMSWSSSPGQAVENAVIRLIDELIEDYPIDQSRIYLAGGSMGAYGIWHLAANYPSRFAAIIPVAGGGDPGTAARLKTVPCWAIHGTNDRTVKIENSENMVEAVIQQGGDARLTRLKGVGHNSWAHFRRSPEKYLDWLFGHQKDSANGP